MPSHETQTYQESPHDQFHKNKLIDLGSQNNVSHETKKYTKDRPMIHFIHKFVPWTNIRILNAMKTSNMSHEPWLPYDPMIQPGVPWTVLI